MFKNIMDMTPQEIIIVNGLGPVAEEAMMVAKLIHKKFTFKIGEDKIEVWGDPCNHEYITHDGVWQARYLHQSYDVECTAEGIFNLFRAEYLVNNGFVSGYANGSVTEMGELQVICRYFRAFVNRSVAGSDKEKMQNEIKQVLSNLSTE